MFETPGAEYGGERQAIAPQVIGNIEIAIGCGTVTRGNGIAVQALVGDAVCPGDVVETAADGLIEIRFIDGTTCKISRGARVALGAFTAGQTAKAASSRVHGPVGTIRSRANGGGWGLLSLAALIFPMLKEAQAADSNVTLLDDDNITYKDSEHGSFELITKEPIPRHIIVEDPGQTVVVKRIGSSVSVEPGGNTAARMEELQLAQQDVLANWAKGLGQTGSSAYPFATPEQLLQPINFIQNDSPELQNQLAPIGSTVVAVPELFTPHSAPTLAITSIAGQIGISTSDIINASKADAGVEIVGTTSGVENGQIVTITIVDSSKQVVYSGTTTVANNSWSVDLSPAQAKSLADGIYTLTADVSNAAGDPADATRTIRVDETPPTIAIDTVVRHNVVNVNAASIGFTIAGTVSDAENGQPVTVRIVDGSGQVVDTFTTTLTNNTWSVNVSSTEAKSLHDGSYTVTADVSDTAGNPAPEATQSITVDETPPKVTWSPQAESGVEGTTIALGAITATVNSLPGHIDNVQSLVVSGIPVGAVLTDCTNSFTATSGETSIDVASWNLSKLKITLPNDTNFNLTVTATDQDGNAASASELVKVTPLAPCLNPVAAHGNEDAAIALDLGVTAKSLSGANGDASPNSLDTLVVGHIPVGATLSDGTGLPGHCFTATIDDTSQDVAGWSLSSLTITPPAGFDGCFTLTIAATERDSEGDISATVTACELVKVAPVAEPPTASAPTKATTAANTAIDISGVVVGPTAEDADDRVVVLLTVMHGTLAVCPVAGVTETVNCQGSLTVSGTASEVNTALASLIYTPTTCFTGCDTLKVSVTSQDGSDTYPTQATAATAITVTPNSESLIVGGPGPTLDWNDPANWSDDFVPTLSVKATMSAPCNYTVSITDAADAQAKSLTIPHGAASTDITASGTLQLAGDLNVCDPGKFENDGTLEETTNAAFNGPITNSGTVIVDPDVYLDVTGTIIGVGKFWIDSGTTLEFAFGSKVAPGTTDSQMVYFDQDAGKLIIDDWEKFAGVITGTAIGAHLTPADLIDLTQLPFVAGSMSVSISYNAGFNISTVTFSDGVSANNVALHLSGNYTDSTWNFASVNGGAGTEVSDPPANSDIVTSDAMREIAAASAATIDFASANDTDTSLVPGVARNFTSQIVDSTGDGAASALSAGQTFTSSPTKSAGENATPMHGAGPHGFEPSFVAKIASGGTVGTPGDSFHFRDENSGSKGPGAIDVAEIHASMHHHDDAATDGPQATSDGGETSGPPGESFHFKDEISSSKGSGLVDFTEPCQTAASIVPHESVAATHVPPAISDGAQAIELPSPEQHPDDHFNIVARHAPSALVTQMSHDLIA
jgi:Bacterial Ig-like domain